ncbi:SGNH/GDSL hydrolase family protein [bacterium]|nr:SGNH/GDSL hydrolase family protein [bacterium]
MNTATKKTLFSATALLLTLFTLEFTLQLTCLFSPKTETLLSRETTEKNIPTTLEDEKLGWRPNPQNPEHDEKGFRNKTVPQKTEIAALGDSQTYGVGVSPENAWTKQLGKMLEKDVYSLAYGGYGQTHNLILLDEAFQLKPKLVVETFYTGNDLYDCFAHVYEKKQFPELKSTQADILQKIRELETQNPLKAKISATFENLATKPAKEKINPETSLKEFLAEKSKLYGLFRAVKKIYELKTQKTDWQKIRQEAKQKQDCLVVETEKIKTVLTPNYRFLALNLNDPRIAEGFRISLEAIRLANEKAKSQGVKFLVLIIPTKEIVFENFVAKGSNKTYTQLLENEKLVSGRLKTFLQTQKIDFVDALPELVKFAEQGKQPYKAISDGHPNENGYKTIAKTVFEKISAR